MMDDGERYLDGTRRASFDETTMKKPINTTEDLEGRDMIEADDT